MRVRIRLWIELLRAAIKNYRNPDRKKRLIYEVDEASLYSVVARLQPKATLQTVMEQLRKDLGGDVFIARVANMLVDMVDDGYLWCEEGPNPIQKGWSSRPREVLYFYTKKRPPEKKPFELPSAGEELLPSRAKTA